MPVLHRSLRVVRSLAHAPLTRWLWFSLCALYITWPLFAASGQLNEFRDAHILQNYELVAVKSVREYGELPLWNPYACGGMYALGTPQSRFAAPPFLLSLLLGPLNAPAAIAFFMTLLGAEGFFRYARTRATSALFPALIAPLFAAHGYMAWSYLHGWVNFYGFLLVPWVLYGVNRSGHGELRGIATVAVAFAFIVGFGGTYAAPFAALFACVEALRVLGERAHAGRSLKTSFAFFSLAAYVALLMCAFRLWPVVESLIAAPRIMAGAPGSPLSILFKMTLEQPEANGLGATGHLFVGLPFAALAVLGLVRLRVLVPLALIGITVWLAAGYQAHPSSFAWLRDLPVYSTLRYPARFLIMSSLYAGEIAAIGTDRWLRLSRKLAVIPCLITLVVFGLSVEALREQHKNFETAAHNITLSPPPVELLQPFKQARGNRWLMGHYPAIERGSLSCWEAYPVPMSSLLRSDLPEEQYLADASAGTLRTLHWSPNHITLELALKKPTRVLINQNYHPGWKSSLGRVVSQQGLLAVDVPAGQHQLALSFRPRSFVFGALVSLLALLAVVLLFMRRTRWAIAALMLAPLLVGMSFLSSEPLPIPAAPTNSDGSPVLVPRVPHEAQPLRVQFSLPVTLEGVVPPGAPDDSGHSSFALFWRVSGAVPRDVGVSVLFASNKNQRKTVEYEVAASSMFFADAPRAKLLRDLNHVQLRTRPGETWKMYVALWHISGDKTRVPIASGGGRELNKNRVVAAEF